MKMSAHKQDQHDGDNDKYVDQILSDGDAATEPPLLCRPSSPSAPQVIFSNITIINIIIHNCIINFLILSKQMQNDKVPNIIFLRKGILMLPPPPPPMASIPRWVILMTVMMMSTHDVNM